MQRPVLLTDLFKQSSQNLRSRGLLTEDGNAILGSNARLHEEAIDCIAKLAKMEVETTCIKNVRRGTVGCCCFSRSRRG
jgi:hypothetical protein